MGGGTGGPKGPGGPGGAKYKIQTRKRRGRGKKTNTFTIMLTNLRGYRSKEYSLKKIIKKLKPAVVVMNETNLTGNMKVDLTPYVSWNRNRSGQGGGGVATAVAQEYRDAAVGAGEGAGEDEYVITRIDTFSPAISIVNCYGEQRRTRVEEVEARWLRMRGDMEAIRARGEHCVLAGDLNKLVGCGELGVEGNTTEVSAGGKLLLGLLATREWVLVNAMGKEVVQGGPNTRVDPATGVGSCLDMFVVSRELEPHVTSLVIDQGREVTVARAVREVGGARLVYSDHHTCLLTLTDLPRRKELKEKKETMWNLAKPGGWNRYQILTGEASEKIADIADSETFTVEEKYRKFDKIHEKIKFQAFGKKNIRKRKDVVNDDDTKDAKEILEEQKKIAAAEIEEINVAQHSKVGKIWEIKKKILGNKNIVEASAIKDPKTNKLVVDIQQIKDVTLNYCKTTLENNDPEEDMKDEIEKKKKMCEAKLQETDGKFETNKEVFDSVIEKFRLSRKKNYDFLVKASKEFQHSLLKMCQAMLEKEQFPSAFKNTTLHMIFKGGKGRKENLTDNRFIHSKSWFPRLAEALLVQGGMKGPLVEGSTIYQIGGQPGHRPEELIFAIKSLIAKQRQAGKAVIIQCWDISKFFDKEMIQDAVLTCFQRKVNPKVVRLWHKLNDDTRIRVKTGAGVSSYTSAGAVVGQGTIGGALVSQAVLDEGVSAEFSPGDKNETNYGEVKMGPCIFQDDLIHISKGIKEANEASRKVNAVMKKLNLKLNKEKSVALFMDSKKQREEIQSEVETNPLVCGNLDMNIKESEKWLGQQLATGGLSDSVAATVAAREGKIKGAALEIVAIVNDWRSEAAGGMEVALTMWEACILPSHLQGAGTWVQISPVTERKLNSLQQWFIRLVLRVGPGAPLASLGWETGMLDMKLRVWREKVMLVMHLRQLGEGTLASQVYREQVARDWPGLAKETRTICENLNIEDCNKTRMSKQDFKVILKTALLKKDEEILREQAGGKRKCEFILKEKYGKKEYISQKKIEDVRNCYKSRVGMQAFAGNFPSDRRFAKTNWLCRCQQEREHETHIKDGKCPIYQDIRADYGNLENTDSLVAFYTRVLERRDRVDLLEQEEQEEQEEDGEDPALAVGQSAADVCWTSSSQSSHAHGLD